MLASLLPGFRDARTPLTVGILWIAIAGVWWASSIPGPSEATGLIEQLYRLNTMFGSIAFVTILGFSGYLLGMFLSFAHLDWTPIRKFLPKSLSIVSWQSEYSLVARRRQLDDEITAQNRKLTSSFEDFLADRTDDESYEYQVEFKERMHELAISNSQSSSLESDIRLMSMRLQSSHPSVYDDYDRLQAEADFRRAIALPISVLIASVLIQTFGPLHFWSGLLVAVISFFLLVALHILSWRKSQEGNDWIIQSWNVGYVEAPSIEVLQKILGELKKLRNKYA